MTGSTHLTLGAFVSESEQAAARSAAGHLTRILSEAASVPWTCDCVFSSGVEGLRQGEEVTAYLTSFLPELQKLDEPWAAAEQRLRKVYASLSERNIPVFICTILRHINLEESPERRAALRLRIRQLNLLAAEISHETRAYVIDLDRLVADIGARNLLTDYRLGGTPVVEVAGHFMALTLINNAFDARIPFEIQDRANAILVSNLPVVLSASSSGSENLPTTLANKPLAAPIAHTIEEIYPGWLSSEETKAGLREVAVRLVKALYRNGVRGTVSIALQRYDLKKNLELFTYRISRKLTGRK